MFYLRIKDGWAKALLSRIALIYGGGRNNMNAEKNAEYQYEMVVNIVAEMVIEYLKTTTRAINEENTKVSECDQNGHCHSSVNAA